MDVYGYLCCRYTTSDTYPVWYYLSTTNCRSFLPGDYCDCRIKSSDMFSPFLRSILFLLKLLMKGSHLRKLDFGVDRSI